MRAASRHCSPQPPYLRAQQIEAQAFLQAFDQPYQRQAQDVEVRSEA